MLLPFLQRHNGRITENISSNLVLATLVLGLSVFTYGFETTVLSSTQAMTRTLSPTSNIPTPVLNIHVSLYV